MWKPASSFMIKGYSFSGFEQYEQRFERLLIPARRRCSSFTMSIWHSPTPILENQREKAWVALLKNSVSISLAAGKRVSQFDGSICVKHVTVQSLVTSQGDWSSISVSSSTTRFIKVFVIMEVYRHEKFT